MKKKASPSCEYASGLKDHISTFLHSKTAKARAKRDEFFKQVKSMTQDVPVTELLLNPKHKGKRSRLLKSILKNENR